MTRPYTHKGTYYVCVRVCERETDREGGEAGQLS